MYEPKIVPASFVAADLPEIFAPALMLADKVFYGRGQVRTTDAVGVSADGEVGQLVVAGPAGIVYASTVERYDLTAAVHTCFYAWRTVTSVRVLEDHVRIERADARTPLTVDTYEAGVEATAERAIAFASQLALFQAGA